MLNRHIYILMHRKLNILAVSIGWLNNQPIHSFKLTLNTFLKFMMCLDQLSHSMNLAVMKIRKKHSQWVMRVPIHTPLWMETTYMHYVLLHSMQTLFMPIHHTNHPLKELEYTAESAQQICKISLIVYQSLNDTKETNQFWYLTWLSR